MKSFIVVSLILVAVVSEGAKLPSTFKKCNKSKPNFNKCLSDSIQDVIKKLNKPMPDYGLASLEVLKAPNFKVEFGNLTYGLHQIYSDFIIIGLDKPSKTEANLDFSTKTLKIKLTFPEIQTKVKFQGKGRIVLLPVDVTTQLDLVFSDVIYDFTFEMEEYGSDAKFWKVAKSDLKINTKKVLIKFANLFENKKLNDDFNAVLSENGLKIFDLYKYHAHNMAPLFAMLFKGFLEKVAVAELFEGMEK